MFGWLFVLRIVLPWILRLRRALLEQEDRQQHVGGHLQELTLPVLEDRGDEVTAGKVGAEADSRQRVKAELLFISLPRGYRVEAEGVALHLRPDEHMA